MIDAKAADWHCTIAGHHLASSSMTAGQHSALFLSLNQWFPHAELDIRPAHCPLCRQVIAVHTLVCAGVEEEVAAVVVANLPVDELVACFLPAAPATPSSGAGDLELDVDDVVGVAV